MKRVVDFLLLTIVTLPCLLISSCKPSPSPPPYKYIGPVHRGVVVDGEPKALGDSFGFVPVKAIEGYADQFEPIDILVPLFNAPKMGEEVLFQMYDFRSMNIGTRSDSDHYGGANLLVREPVRKTGGDN